MILNSARVFASKYDIDVHEVKPGTDGIIGIKEVIQQLSKKPPKVVVKEPIYSIPQSFKFQVMPPLKLRPYQEEVCNIVLHNYQIKSGVIVMPCGSGKTMVGCKICVIARQQTLIITTRQPQQWKNTLVNKFNVSESDVHILGENTPSNYLQPIVITTYSMLCTQGFHTTLVLLRQNEVGLVILDEVHTSAARQYMYHIEHNIPFRSCIGLTATPLREDDGFERISAVVGPVLHVVDKQSLETQNYLAKVTCFTYIVPISQQLASIGGRIADLNPYKMDATELTLRHLLEHKRKTLLFCDDIECLQVMHMFLTRNGLPISGPIHMKTNEKTRQEAYSSFTNNENGCVLALSRVGDDALDLPEASAILIVWNRWKSRRQIMQRIGRISRPGRPAIVILVLSNYEKELAVQNYRENYLKEQKYALKTQMFEDSIYKDKFKLRNSCIKKREGALLEAYENLQKTQRNAKRQKT